MDLDVQIMRPHEMRMKMYLFLQILKRLDKKWPVKPSDPAVQILYLKNI